MQTRRGSHKGPDALPFAAEDPGGRALEPGGVETVSYTHLDVYKRQTIDNAISRINSWWVIAIVVGFALLCGRSGVTLLFALVSLAALREFVAAGIPNMPDVPGSYPRAIIPGTVLLIVPLQYLLVWKGSYLLFTALIPCLVWVVLPILGGLLSARIPGSVSYTHLDVYKRQGQARRCR